MDDPYSITQILWSTDPMTQRAIAIVSGDHLLFPGPRLDQTLLKLGRALAGERDVQ